MAIDPLEAWHRIVRERDAAGLDALLADDVVFYSPVVHTPQAVRIGRLAAPLRWGRSCRCGAR